MHQSGNLSQRGCSNTRNSTCVYLFRHKMRYRRDGRYYYSQLRIESCPFLIKHRMLLNFVSLSVCPKEPFRNKQGKIMTLKSSVHYQPIEIVCITNPKKKERKFNKYIKSKEKKKIAPLREFSNFWILFPRIPAMSENCFATPFLENVKLKIPSI